MNQIKIETEAAKKINTELIIFRFALKKVNFIVKILFWVTLITVIIKQFVLNRFEAPNKVFYDFGVFISEISYSILSAIILYLFIQHLPDYKKRATVHLSTSYNIIMINYLFRVYLFELECKLNPSQFFDEKKQYIKEDIELLLLSTNTEDEITTSTHPISDFESIFDYTNTLFSLIQNYIDNTLIYNNFLEDKIFKSLTTISVINSEILSENRTNIIPPNFSHLNHHFIMLYDEMIILMEAFKALEIDYEYHYNLNIEQKLMTLKKIKEKGATN